MSGMTAHRTPKAIGACVGVVLAGIAAAAITGGSGAAVAALGGLACAAMMAMMVWMMLAPLLRRGSTPTERPAEPQTPPAPGSPRG